MQRNKMPKVNGKWNITYVDTMIKSTMILNSDGSFEEVKSGLKGTFSLDKNDLTFEFPSITLPGETNQVPLVLEAELNDNHMKFRGSIYNGIYQGGRMAVLGERENTGPDHAASLIGDWEIDYQNTTTQTTITFHDNGSFYQLKGHYNGKWKIEDENELILVFDTLKLPNEDGPIILKAHIHGDFFSGTKIHDKYNDGIIYFEAHRRNSSF